MKIFADRLTQTPVDDAFEVSANWWLERVADAHELDFEIVGPFRFSVRSYKVGSDVIVEGSLRGEIEAQCGRCLARYRHALRDQFRLVAEEARGRVPPDPEGCESLARDGLWLGDEIESGWYRGSVIQLDGLFAELIAGVIPVHPVCREDCKGLCQVCGVSRNDVACECEAEIRVPKRESPFAVLARLRDDSAGGS